MFGGTFVSGLTETSGIPADLADAVGGVFFGAGLIGLILAVLQIASGAGAFGGRGWARWIGIILSILFAIPLTLSVLTSIGSTSQDGVIQFLVFSIIFLVGFLTDLFPEDLLASSSCWPWPGSSSASSSCTSAR